MSLRMRWVGDDERETVARTRLACFGGADNELQRFCDMLAADRRAVAGDYLLAERSGQPVGTATSLSMQMVIRGQIFACQGVAWVGVSRAQRRGGVASALMREMVRKGRDRGQVVSALMPFRTSFYEKFGYGAVERRVEWTLPLGILPQGDAPGVRFMRPDDLPAVAECERRMALRGQCDTVRSPGAWDHFLAEAESGYIFVDRPVETGPVLGWMLTRTQQINGRSMVWVGDMAWDDQPAFLRLLYLLAGLRDQHWGAVLTMPVDYPLNWVLRETQIPHRPVSHPTAETRVYNRMQLRVLDHGKLMAGLRLPLGYGGEAVVAVREVEGHISRFRLEIADGKAQATPSDATADLECPDRVWAAIACGELPVESAVRLGAAEASAAGRWRVLEALSAGPAPFCRDYF